MRVKAIDHVQLAMPAGAKTKRARSTPAFSAFRKS